MAPQSSGDNVDDQIRETYDEFGVGETRYALIGDPENDNAWIQSDTTAEVEE